MQLHDDRLAAHPLDLGFVLAVAAGYAATASTVSHGTLAHEPTAVTWTAAGSLYVASTVLLAGFGARGWTLAVNVGLAAMLGLVGFLAGLSVHTELIGGEFGTRGMCCFGCPSPFERRAGVSLLALAAGSAAAAPAPLVGWMARRAWAALC